MISRVSLLFALLLTLKVSGASLCEQSFTVLGKSRGEASILTYQEELTGDCEQFVLHLVFIHDSIATSMEKWGLDNPPSFILDFIKPLGQELGHTLADSAGVFRISDSEWLTAPPEDTSFDRRWIELINRDGGNEHDWCVKNRDDCEDYPVFHGVRAELIHENHGGLYKNYSLASVVFYPASRIVVILTHQPRKAVGLDTMHGVLVYRLGQPMPEVQKATED